MMRSSSRVCAAVRCLSLSAAVCLLVACGSTGPVAPAPIETRTQPPASTRAAGPSAADKAAASRPAPAIRPAPGSAAATAGSAAAPGLAESSAVRASGVEVRPLETRPGSGPPTASPPATSAPSDPPLTLQRSTESRAGASGAAASASAAGPVAAPAANVPGASGPLKSGPRGTKRLFSNEVLAEMRAADPGPPPPAPMASPEAGAAPSLPSAQAPAGPSAAPGTIGPAGAPTESGPVELAWPLRGKLLEGFAEPRSMGLSIAADAGDAVLAAADGKVIFSGTGPRGYGNLIIVRHDAETLTVYAHNRALLAREGQSVRRGQKIAEVGDSGTDRPQLHFEVRRNGRPVDPLKLLPPQ